MKGKTRIYRLTVFTTLVLSLFFPLIAGAYNFSDIALTPGQDSTMLNLAWNTDSTFDRCVVEIAEKQNIPDTDGAKFPEKCSKFYGTNEYAGLDENSIKTYVCEVTVSGLKESTEYVYRLGHDNDEWSKIYEYSTGNTDKYGFIYLADSQIGASVPRNAKPEEAKKALTNDIAGWVNTVEIIGKEFPQAAFILSGGDQTELPGEEAQWTGFFSPPELTSIPIAPTIGSHDDFPNGRGGAIDDTLSNFDNHFNLPNESSEHGISGAGGDYYFTYGDVLFIVLNMDPQLASYPMPPRPKPGEPPPPCDPAATVNCSDHQEFMKDVISKNPNAKWKIVTWHYSIYSSGSHAADCVILALRDAMYLIIDTLDIDAVLMGHDHCFSRSYQILGNKPQQDQEIGKNGEIINPTGTLYFTANSSSGSKYYKIHPDVGTFDYLAVHSQLMVPSFSYVNIEEDRLTISTYRTDTMKMTDSYTMVKSMK